MDAGGVTFYASLAAVPTVLVATRVAVAVTSPDRVLRLAGDLADALPDAQGAPALVRAAAARAVDLHWWTVLVALLPASLYGEGLRRAMADVRGGTVERFTGWRGRLGLLPLLLAAPGLLLALLAVTPRVNALFGQGGWAAVGGVVVAFTIDWVLTSVCLVWVFRVVAPGELGWRRAAVGGVLTASFVAGFLQGFVLFLSLPIDLGAPFGGLGAVGAVCAVLLWVWLLHVVVLAGYLTTLSARGPDRFAGTAPA